MQYYLNSSYPNLKVVECSLFTASVAEYRHTGQVVCRFKNDATVGIYIYVQPTNTDRASSANIATYTVQFTEAVTNFSVRCAGLNNQDQLRIHCI